ncbi:MAG: ABC-type iron(III) uptake system ATPase component FbpC [Oceanicaulis sp. HLUCCA04]|nr:MAG: ABC-type iron(III) uptake system ATPase component FbpC [Oceanicaulis sp. HLUCCA04]
MPRVIITGAEVRLGGDDGVAVNGASLALHAGQVTALLGPSGAGKSTLLRAVAGLERLHAGEIRSDGHVWSGPGIHLAPERRRCGVVFQDFALFPHLTAIQNVAFGLRHLSGAARRQRVMESLAAVELTHRARAYPHELSGGEQQRVALARALAPEPAVMLLDEPFSGLDRRLRTDLSAMTLDVLRRSGTASLIITHDADDALASADDIALMERGTIIQSGRPDTLYLAPSSESAARMLGDVEAFASKVENGAAQTPLGDVSARQPQGSAVTVLVRPEGIVIGHSDAQGLPGSIVSRRPAGPVVAMVIELRTGERVTARAPVSHAARTGDTVSLSLDPAFVSVVER